MTRRHDHARGTSRRRFTTAIGALALLATIVPLSGSAQTDPRVGLAGGYIDGSANSPATAALNIALLDNDPRVAPFDANPGNFGFVNSDLAFTGHHAIVGSFNGFQVYDISDPANPALQSAFVCPGGQGDVSVYGDLLFMAVEETRGRIDCGTQGTGPGNVPNPTERFRGVRIFDISDIDNPVQLPGVQTCRGSHTHTLVTDPDDPNNIYVYNSGTSSIRSATELAGCNNNPPTGEDPTNWRIDVIRVPLENPSAAAIVSQPRIFQDPATGALNGLQNGPTQPLHPSGTPYGPQPNTTTCHDITAFPEIGLAAGACQGNGILLDISDPVNPVRLDAVADPNYSYWHSATFSNDGSKVIFTDEWGGGTSPRCRATDQLNWGADALFDIVDGQMEFRSYYKMPATQTTQENCVAHNSSIVPVPGRDILVQAWYQGGVSVIDFGDTANPVEIAYFDRGPINFPNPTGLNLGGLWSTYWYNGYVYGTEIARGFDTFGLVASAHLSQNEIDAASEIVLDQFNSQLQSELIAAPSFTVVGAYYDQVLRTDDLDERTQTRVTADIDRAVKLVGSNDLNAAAVQLENAARRLPAVQSTAGLHEALLDLADAIRAGI